MANTTNFTKNLNKLLNSSNSINFARNTNKSIINVHSTRNNTIITLTNHLNQPLTWISAGSMGFKSAQKSGYEAGYQSTIALFNKINESAIDSPLHQSKFGPLELHYRGFGQGRSASWSALLSQEGEAFKQRLTLIKDKTNLILLLSNAQQSWTSSVPVASSNLYALELSSSHNDFFEQLRKRDIAYTLTQTFNSSDLFTGAAIHLHNANDNQHLPNLSSVKHIYPINSFNSPLPFVDSDPSLDSSSLSRKRSPYTSSLYPLISGTQAHPSFESVQTLADSVAQLSGFTAAHERNLTGQGVFIAFVDDGVDFTHPALGGCFGEKCPIQHGFDLVGDDYNTTTNSINPGPLSRTTCKSHGTSTLGVAASQLKEMKGGAPNATFGMYRIFGCHGSSGDDILAMGLIRAYEDGADIINVSAGGPDGWTTSLPSVIASRIVEKGRHVVTSAGNYGLQGLLYSNSPAGGIGVTPIAAVDLPYVPLLNASLTIQEVPGQRFPYTPAEIFTAGNTTRKTLVVGDACESLSTQQLDDVAVIIDNEGCNLDVKLSNLKSANATLVLIEDTHDTLSQSPHVDGLATAVLKPNVASQIPANATITLHYTPLLRNNPRAGLISQYSSMGPSADGYGKPAVSVVGSNIPTLAPEGRFMIQSGTSFSAPVYSSLLALLMQQYRQDGKDLSPEMARAIMLGSAQSVNLDIDADGAAFTVLQGSGRANIEAALDASTYIKPDIINFNDTFSGVEKDVQLEIVNTSDDEKVYTLSHHPALTGYVLNEGTIQPSTYLPEYTRDAAQIRHPDTITVAAQSASTVDLHIVPPPVSDHRLPIYSGFVEFSDGSATMKAAYNGIAGDLSKMTILDNTDDLFNQGFPVPFAFRQSDRSIMGQDTLNFTMDALDRPAIVYRLAGPSPYMRIDLVDGATPRNATTSSTTAATAPLQRRNILDGVLGWMTDLFGGSGTDSLYIDGIDSLGVLYEELGVSRNGFMGSGQGSSFYRFDMSDTFASGKVVPSGHYKLLLRALKIHGDDHRSADYESWLSDSFIIS
ncbi:hypothetical protein E3P99_03449 [Wallemia hederae]|uniref:Peptidase S8/S53 domain-containing protein n=1 Tax=Wallemia hederae TaxID=1540922 RepID=A0A4T0FG44_9BASI|nr:hypothetical protein E3P99_03449 [Wallemia hederae]